MSKSLTIAYILWFIGGWFGFHHLYLGRDRHAFVCWCLFPGYGGIGWFNDMYRIKRYVAEANFHEGYLLSLTNLMRAKPKPPFSICRFGFQLLFGNLMAWVVSRAVPEEPVLGYSLLWLNIFVPLGSAIGVHTVGNMGKQKGPLLPTILAAYLMYVGYIYGSPHYYFCTVSAAVVFRYYVEWKREPPMKRTFFKRVVILGSCGLIYFSLWGSYLYFNMEMTNEHGEQIKFRDSVQNLLKAPIWYELTDSLGKLWDYYRVRGWKTVWDEIVVHLDLMGERNALSVLELPSSASQEEITKRWRELSRKYHPDKFPDSEEKAAAQEKFMEVKEAYEKISVINSKRKRKSSRSIREDL